jgi:hypothetical protein
MAAAPNTNANPNAQAATWNRMTLSIARMAEFHLPLPERKGNPPEDGNFAGVGTVARSLAH